MFKAIFVCLNRKRKKISTLKSFAGPNDGCEDEESQTGCSGFKRPYLVKHTSAKIL